MKATNVVTMTTMDIISDAASKLNKIFNGTVFDSPLVWITELFQNAHRSGAKNVTVSIKKDGSVLVYDDGCGCRTPKPVLTLDYSSWDSTDEGFGMGFWSVLALPGIETVRVASKNWVADIVVAEMLSSGTPQATVTRTEDPFDGFLVLIKSSWILEHLEEVVDEIREVGKYQMFNLSLNGEVVPKVQFVVEGEFVRTFETRTFTAQLAVAESEYTHPVLYYENRKVCTIYSIDGVSGIVQVNPHVLSLKEPDRKSVVQNAKYDRFVNRVQACVKDLYREFIPVSTDAQLDKYSNIIDHVLSVADYEGYLRVPGLVPTLTTVAPVMAPSAPSRVTIISGESDIDAYAEDDAEVESNVCDLSARAAPARVIRRQKANTRGAMKKVSKKTWVKASELGNPEIVALKAKAEYYGVNVWVAWNVLYERVYTLRKVPHISDIKNGIVKRNIKKDVSLKTGKEEKFIRLLRPICAKYNLPENTFLIGNISLVVETRLGDKVIDKEVVPVGGVQEGDKIILNRKTLGLKRFNLRAGDKVGLADIRALMANVITIAHELAHLKYRTDDNSVNHYQVQDAIHDEIVALYL